MILKTNKFIPQTGVRNNMNDDLITKGLNLVKKLNIKMSEYHEKSSHYELLSWEIVGIETRITELQNNNVKNKDSSDYNIEWGKEVHNLCHDLANEISNFYNEYNQWLNT